MEFLVSHIPKIYLVVIAGGLLLIIAKRSSRWIAKRDFIRKHGCKPPANPRPSKRWLPWGFDILFDVLNEAQENRFLDYWKSQYAERGRTIQINFLHKTNVITIEPKNVQTILALKFKDFELGERKECFRPLLGHGIFSSDGETWERSRALLRPNFMRNQVADMDVYEVHVKKLIDLIPRDGSTVDLQQLFFRMTLDSATEFLFGESVGSLDPSSPLVSSSFAHNFQTAQDGLAFRIRIGAVLSYFHRSNEFTNAVRETRAFVNQFVERAIKHRTSLEQTEEKSIEKEKNYVFLNELSKQTLDKTILTDQLLSILLAGRDTTASLLSMIFFVLARRPDVWKKLRANVDHLDSRKPSFEQLKDMKYLNWVINETLRLYPIVPLNAREANKDTFLPVGGGPDGKSPVFVAKGRNVVYHPYVMHRLPEIYGPDAEEFRPERWENLKPGWAYLPFNGGPRICIGQQFALAETGFTVVRMMQHFKAIESRDPEPWKEGLTITLASKNGTKVALTPF